LISLLKKVENYTQFSGLKNMVRSLLWKFDLKAWFLSLPLYDYKLKFKAAGIYLLNAAIEGIKQNLFGPNINMEFLVLTFRAGLLVFAGFLLKLNFTRKERQTINTTFNIPL
jgi:hypothetical protein